MKKTILTATLVFSSLAPASHAATAGTFYLDAKIGCYAADKSPTKSHKWSTTNYKTLYATSCKNPHHYEVYLITKLKAKNLSSDAAQKEASTACSKAARSKINGADVPATLTFAYFFPDPGAEQKKYGTKTICFFRVADAKSDQLSLSISKPIVTINYI